MPILLVWGSLVQEEPQYNFASIIDAHEANHLMEEMHEGLLGDHASGPLLARKIMRSNNYWLTMESDCIKHFRTCHGLFQPGEWSSLDP